MKKAGPLLLLVGIVFLGYWMFTDPVRLAAFTRDAADKAWQLATDLFDALIGFLDELFSKSSS